MPRLSGSVYLSAGGSIPVSAVGRLRYVTDCNALPIELPGFKGRKIQADFCGGDVSSDGGLLVLRQTDRWLGLTKRLGQLLPDPRDPDRITHSLETLLKQRIYGLALGYEDLNDHDTLRHDPLWQTAAERDEALSSSATLCRWENRADRKAAWLMHQVLFEQFVGRFEAPPEALILDFDATDDRVHGAQAKAFYHGYYGDHCFLPLYVFCGEQLLGELPAAQQPGWGPACLGGAGLVGPSAAPAVARGAHRVAG